MESTWSSVCSLRSRGSASAALHSRAAWLEAAIAGAGGFENLEAEETAQLVYLTLSGGRKPGEEKILNLDVAETVADALRGLEDMVAQYADPAMPYLSQPRPMLLGRVGDYDHLARILEWRGRAEDGE